MARSLVPPDQFGVVEAGVYRAAMPAAANVPFLRQLRLRTIVLLSFEPLERIVQRLCDGEGGVRLLHLGKKLWLPETTWKERSESLVKEALEVVLDPAEHPLLLCCPTGSRLVGPVVACLRKLQRWALSPVLEEYCSFAGSMRKRSTAMHFIEQFDCDCVCVPPTEKCPPWYRLQMEIEAEEVQQYRSDEPPGPLLPEEAAALPAYKLWYWCNCAPPISAEARFDPKESIVDDDD
eukprot:TRINITY_DN47576_c0_g1_i1.p1 TRINITY_DN47576_c0_g1~~TRINITY_DN47576_c0_g1_i1.p1  ORF type:complete len:235 (+),score=79.29 TRINITY_DN47576_c0_g1_i1:77-781(+)